MAGPSDDLDAVRTVVEALKGFPADDQRRIIRWAEEKLGLTIGPASKLAPMPSTAQSAATPATSGAAPAPPAGDIRSFVQAKRPNGDIQFAAVVAYFYAFEAREDQKKPEISGEVLQEAARLAGRERLVRPIMTLHNAAQAGYLDKGQARGTFRINTVGENLVAMALPQATEAGPTARRPAKRKRAKAAIKGRNKGKT